MFNLNYFAITPSNLFNTTKSRTLFYGIVRNLIHDIKNEVSQVNEMSKIETCS